MNLLFPISLGLGSTFSHCVSMCSPLHMMASSQRNLAFVLLFHATRILTYLLVAHIFILGIIAADFLESPLYTWIWKVCLFILYLYYASRLIGLKLPMKHTDWTSSLLSHKYLARWTKEMPSAFYLGLINGILPCPMTFSIYLWTMSTGSYIQSISGVFLFALMTALLPLTYQGILSRKINFKIRESALKKFIAVYLFAYALFLMPDIFDFNFNNTTKCCKEGHNLWKPNN